MHYPFIIFNSEGSGQPATRYICGFSGSDSTLIIMQDRLYLLVDGRYWEQAENEIQNSKTITSPKVEVVKIHRNYLQKRALLDIFKKHSLKSLHLDSRITSYAIVQALEKYKVNVVGCDGVLQHMREIKSADEMVLIEKSQRIALTAFEKFKREVVCGVTERALAAKLEYVMKCEGADGPSFETIVASGPHSALPHATVTDRKIEASDAVIVDFGARVDGYCSDFTRTILMPKASPKLKKIYSIVQRAQTAALKCAIVGTPLKSIDGAARQVIEKAGYGMYFTHSTGHGVGMEVHELPYVSYRSTSKLQIGHVITVEPGVYIPGLGGVRLEEMVVAHN
ncbi:MAG: aminopeptidase P family protein [Candidatus Roizmanbacteria bacterium]